MANGLLDPVFQIFPSKVDAKRRSWDPLGLTGAARMDRGHLVLTGRSVLLRKTKVFGIGHLTLTGRTSVINRVRPIGTGHLQVAGKVLNTKLVKWLTIPRFDINWASITYPYFINGMRANYLIDATGSVQSVTLGGIDVAQISYDESNDRIVIASNPGSDVVDSVYMVADGLASNTFQIALVNPISYPIYLAENESGGQNPNAFDSVPSLVLHPGDYYGQVGAISPVGAGTVVFGDNGYMLVDFIDQISGTASAPTFVNVLRSSVNGASVTVPVSTLPGLVAGQDLLMMVATISAIDAASITTMAGQGWVARGSLIQASTLPDMYFFSKKAGSSEPNVVIGHSVAGGGRLGVFVTAWNSTGPIFIDANALFSASTTLSESPSVTPTQENVTLVSFVCDNGSATYLNQPTNYTLIDQFRLPSVFWLGAAYRRRSVIVASGIISWNVQNAGGAKAGATIALRGTQQTITKIPFTIPMRHHTSTGPGEDGFGNTFWSMQVLPP